MSQQSTSKQKAEVDFAVPEDGEEHIYEDPGNLIESTTAVVAMHNPAFEKKLPEDTTSINETYEDVATEATFCNDTYEDMAKPSSCENGPDRESGEIYYEMQESVHY